MIRFRWLGVRWKVSTGFFAALFLFLTLDAGGMALEVLAAAVIHELGHLAAAAVLSVSVSEISLTLSGLKICGEEPLFGRNGTIVLAAGPVSGLLWAALAWKMGWMRCSAASAALSCYHLLPLKGLDGGSLARRFFCTLFGEPAGNRLTEGFCTVFCASGILLLAVRSARKGISPGTVFLSAVLIYGLLRPESLD